MLYIDEIDFVEELIEVYGGKVTLSQVKTFLYDKLREEE